jgi:1,2-diacylglycerol 3-beta-galactosyltransferase
LPGQEEGNVRFVVDNGAGRWAPGPGQVVAAIRELTAAGPGALAEAAANARRLARPRAALEIAKEIGKYLPESK